MDNRFHYFIKILEALEKYKVEYVLIDGLAVILYGLERYTKNFDMFVNRDPGI